jgi:hypothetical protein
MLVQVGCPVRDELIRHFRAHRLNDRPFEKTDYTGVDPGSELFEHSLLTNAHVFQQDLAAIQ